MSSSEDDRPLAARASAAAPKAEPASAAKAGPVAPPPKRAIDDSSEDDAPLAARAKVWGGVCVRVCVVGGATGAADRDRRPHPIPQPAAKKPAAAKPKPAPKPRTKPAAAASTPAVKKERKTFDLPGQTREPPPEVCVGREGWMRAERAAWREAGGGRADAWSLPRPRLAPASSPVRFAARVLRVPAQAKP